MENKRIIKSRKNKRILKLNKSKAYKVKDISGYKSPEKYSLKIRIRNTLNTNSILKNSFFLKRNITNQKFNSNLFEEKKENTPIYSTIYDFDFFNNILEKEKTEKKINEEYLIKHPKLNSKHRAILVDWMIELSEEMALKRDTLYSAVNYFDRFLSLKENIEKNILQLIGITCINISAKFQVFNFLFNFNTFYRKSTYRK
jgi:hypothetical protein